MSSLTQCENVSQTFEVDAGRRSADDDVWNVSQASKVKIEPFFAGKVAFPFPLNVVMASYYEMLI